MSKFRVEFSRQVTYEIWIEEPSQAFAERTADERANGDAFDLNEAQQVGSPYVSAYLVEGVEP